MNHLIKELLYVFPLFSGGGPPWKLQLIIDDFNKKASVILCNFPYSEKIYLVQNVD